jgi:beta-lactamase class A
VSKRRIYPSRISSQPIRAEFFRSKRYRKRPMSAVLRFSLMSGATLVAVVVGVMFTPHGLIKAQAESTRPSLHAQAHNTPSILQRVSQFKAPAAQPRASRPEPPAPASLQTAIDRIAEDFGEPIGIAVSDVDAGWVASVGGDQLYPQQSVSKTWVAMTVMEAIDRGALQLTTPVTMADDDRSVFNEPLARTIENGGTLVVTVADLLHHALIASDNSANDTLIRVVGLANVRDMLTRKGLAGITLGADERHLQSMISGLVWQPAYGEGRNFEQARAKLPVEVRTQAMEAYLAHPYDGASPKGIVRALASFKRGEILSQDSTDYMLGILDRVRTGPERLKGGLAPGWRIAHKTGTGQDFKGMSVGINDVGLLTAPDGHTYSVAVMIPQTRQQNGDRLKMMQSVTEAVEHHWQAAHQTSNS